MKYRNINLIVLIVILFSSLVACEKNNVDRCQNGIKDNGEVGIDCGGDCPACPIDPCHNGIEDNGETWIDCGGSCKACPVPYFSAVLDSSSNTWYASVECFWGPCGPSAQSTDSTLRISGSNYYGTGITSFSIRLHDTLGLVKGVRALGPNTYILNTWPGAIYSYIIEGEIDVTQINTGSKLISGTFSFTCFDPFSNSIRTVTNGKFGNVPYY